jgi:hypothetical protein
MKLNKSTWSMVSREKSKPNSRITEFMKPFRKCFALYHSSMSSIAELWSATEVCQFKTTFCLKI